MKQNNPEPQKFSKTKIVATVGPASSSKEVLKEMIMAGVNVCRINSSHGSYEHHQKVIQHIREINAEYDMHTAILVDLQGPKIRIGMIENDKMEIHPGQEIIFSTGDFTGTAKNISINYKDFPKDVNPGERILIDDGKLELEIIETNKKDTVKAKVTNGGILSSRKGVNLPNTHISLPCLTPKDMEDLEFALSNDVEWIGLSFVRTAADITELRKLIAGHNKSALIIAKIEKPEAVKNIDSILAVTDGLMVARGDLGVEMPMHEVPLIQKMLVHRSILASRPVIIATQMMESMISNFSPTRAEVNDVANAVMDGADAVMLSGETSVGKYPVKVVEYMKNIVNTVEKNETIYNRHHPPDPGSETFISDSVCYNACVMAHQVGARGIIGMTHSGYTGFKVSSHRPKADVFIFTDNRPLVNSLSLLWGVRGFFYDKYVSTNHTIAGLKSILRSKDLIHEGDRVINIASIPMGERGRANMIKLSEVN